MSGKPVTVDDEGRLSFETDPQSIINTEVASLKPCSGCGMSREEATAKGLGAWQGFTADGSLAPSWQCDACYDKATHKGPMMLTGELLEVPYEGCVCPACTAARPS